LVDWIRRAEEDSSGNPSVEALRFAADVVLLEMVSRVGKVLFRRGMRNTQRGASDAVVEEPLLATATRLCNLLFGDETNREVAQFWRQRVASELSTKFFRFAWSPFWTHSNHVAHRSPAGHIQGRRVIGAIPDIPDDTLCGFVRAKLLKLFSTSSAGGLAMGVLWRRFESMTGLKVAEHVAIDIVEAPDSFFAQPRPFESGDVVRLGLRVKSLNVVEHAQGYISKVHGVEALKAGRVAVAERLFRHSYVLLQSALSRNLLSKVTLRNLGQVVEGFAVCHLHRTGRSEADRDADPLLRELIGLMRELFSRALSCDPSDGHSLVQLAGMHERWTGDEQKALELYRASLAADPRQIPASLGIGRLEKRPQ
jgi:hypothetical protein